MNVPYVIGSIVFIGKRSLIVPARIILGSVTTAVGGHVYYGVVEDLGSVAVPRRLIMSQGKQSINQSKHLFHTLIIKYNTFKKNYVGKWKVEV